MRINTVKMLFAAAISILIGVVCEILAPTTGSRNWISLAVASITLFAGLSAAMGIKYNNERRGVSIKVFAGLLTFALLVCNVAFSCFEYKIDIYIAVSLLLAVIGWAVIYGMVSLPHKE